MLVLIAVLVAYSSILPAGFIWDDDDYVINNDTLRSLGGLWRIWTEFGAVPQYYPLVHTTFWLEFQLWGLAPLGYHLVNLLLHATAAWTLGLIVDQLVGGSRRGLSPGRLAALLFAVHPVMVESAAWITERKNVLSLGLALLALRQLLLWRAGGDKRRYGAAVALFVGAMLSKTVVCSLPAVALVLWWRQRGRLTRRDWLGAVPLLLIGIALAAVTVWMEKHHVGASGDEWALSLGDRLTVAGQSAWFYLGKLLWPTELTFVYPRWQVPASGWWAVAAPLSWLALGGGLLAARARIGRTPLAIWLIFSGVLVPALGFIDVYPFRYSFVADHFQYHAATAVIAGAALLLARLPQRARHGVAAALLIPLAILTWRHGLAFHNEETLWRHTIATNPDAWIAHNNLGIILLARGEFPTAETAFRRTIELKPDHGNAWTNLGLTLGAQGRDADARAALSEGQRLLPDQPAMWRLSARYYASEQDHQNALAAWREILLRLPDDQEALSGAVAALRGLGLDAQAEALLREKNRR